MTIPRVALAAWLLASLPGALPAQQGETEVVAVVQRLFDAMRAKDTVGLRAVFHPDARLAGTGRDQQGRPVLRVNPIDAFIASIGQATAQLDEQFWDPEVRLDDNLATVWTPYVFYVNGELSHCGVDAFQLARGADGWKIVQIADTRRREGYTGPPGR